MEVAAAVLYVVGFLLAWRQLTNGTGFIGSRLSPETLQKLNDGSSSATKRKIGYSLLLGYVIWGAIFIAIIMKIVSMITP